MRKLCQPGTQILSAIRGIAFGGRRYNGGAVDSGKFYRVGESNKPELFQSGGRRYMILVRAARDFPNRDIGGGGGGGNHTERNKTISQQSNGWTEQDSKALQQTIENTAMRLMQRESDDRAECSGDADVNKIPRPGNR